MARNLVSTVTAAVSLATGAFAGPVLDPITQKFVDSLALLG